MITIAVLGAVAAVGTAVWLGRYDARRWLRRNLTPEGRAVGRYLRAIRDDDITSVHDRVRANRRRANVARRVAER